MMTDDNPICDRCGKVVPHVSVGGFLGAVVEFCDECLDELKALPNFEENCSMPILSEEQKLIKRGYMKNG